MREQLIAEIMETFDKLTDKQKEKFLAFLELLREEGGGPHAGA